MATTTEVKNDTRVSHACAPAPYPPSTDAGRLGSNDNNRGSFVMTTLDRIWKMGYVNSAFKNHEDVMVPSKGQGTTVISYRYIDPLPISPEKQEAMVKGMGVWQNYANVLFIEHPQDDNTATADIRISFCTTSGTSWSAVGATKTEGGDGADKYGATKPTINLGVLTDGKPLKEQATILHELGHVLGMMHEHQSPARGVKITLKIDEVYKYYRPFLGFNDKLVKSQVIDEYKQSESNFSHFDPTSIMMYFMPAHLNVEQVEVRPNLKLSELDKAYIQLAYPHNNSGRLLSAMGVIGVPESDALKIIEPISIYATGDESLKKEWWDKIKGADDSEKEPELKHFLREVRKAFFDYNKRNIEAQALLQVKKKAAGIQDPLKDPSQLTTQAQGVESADDSSAKPVKPKEPLAA